MPKRTAPKLTKWSVERQMEDGKDALFPGGALAGFGMRVGIKGHGLCVVWSYRALSQDNCHHVLPAEHGQERPDVRPTPCPPSPWQEGFHACRAQRRHGVSPRVTLLFRSTEQGNWRAFHGLRPDLSRGRPPCTAGLRPAWPHRRPAPSRRRDRKREDVLPEVTVVKAFCQ